MSQDSVLLIDVCSQTLHSLEFVRPIKDILTAKNIKVKELAANQLNNKILDECDAVIICGTSLLDDEYLEDLDVFSSLKECDKPILGICAGMQILIRLFGGSLIDCLEIGLTTIMLEKPCFGLKGEVEVYELHQYATLPDESVFESIAHNSSCAQIVFHRKKKIVGTMFHPEVRNKELIVEFFKNKT